MTWDQEIYVGVAVGVILLFLGGLWAYSYKRALPLDKSKRRLLGIYSGYGYANDSIGQLHETPVSTAEIYLSEDKNRLEIAVTHGKHTWVGELTFSTARKGTLSWTYTTSEMSHKNGEKTFVVRPDYNTVEVKGMPGDGHGTEVFKRA
jgi:hypothetical protein